MTRLTLVTALTLAVLLLCGSPSQIQAQSDTKIVIGDGGSILMRLDGRDAGKTWTVNPDEILHGNSNGVLVGLQIFDGTTDQCNGNPSLCGVDATKPWSIQVTYVTGGITIESVTSERGVHLTKSGGLPFDQWYHTKNVDERELGKHGDGNHITGITVAGKNLCSGKGCQVIANYSPR